MNSLQSHRRAGAFTLVELLTVIAIIGILAALLLPAVTRSQMRAKRIVCVNDLGQMGIAFQIFMHDHGGKFPMQVPMSDGGSQEFVQNGYAVGGEFYFSYRHFQVLSNESIVPKILVCPADTRLPAVNLSALQNANLSYFIGVNADYDRPGSVLAGDRNIANVPPSNPSIVHGGVGNRLRWTRELHETRGNVLFSDAHVEEWTPTLLSASPGTAGTTADYFLPSFRPGQPGAPSQTSGSASRGFGASPGSSRPPGNPSSGNYTPPPNQPNPAPAPVAAKQPASPMYSSSQPNNGVVNNSSVARAIPNGLGLPPNATSAVRKTMLVTNITTVTTTQDVTANLSTFDKRVVKTVGPMLAWGYLLLLLLALLILALETRRRILRKRKRRAALRR
jgi:prepilin-type N-terminal cleavage/methylation domain-containing protein/prepilin-type processing-associated H-X9-DG protein